MTVEKEKEKEQVNVVVDWASAGLRQDHLLHQITFISDVCRRRRGCGDGAVLCDGGTRDVYVCVPEREKRERRVFSLVFFS